MTPKPKSASADAKDPNALRKPPVPKPAGAAAAAKSGGSSKPPGGAPAEETDLLVEDDDSTKRLFVKIFPWILSICVHCSFVLIAVFVVYVTVHQSEDLEEQEAIIPVVALGVKPGGPRATGPVPGMPGNPNAPKDKRTMTATKYKQELGGAEGSGAGNKSGGASGSSKVDSSLSGIIGSGGGQGGGNPGGSPFGSVVGHGDGPFRNPGLYGTGGGNVKRVVYVIDASGSLLDSLPFVLVELRRSISQLGDSQFFSVIFFQDEHVLEVPPINTLKPATSENKNKAVEWMSPEAGNVVTAGTTRPVEAITRALSLKPELVFILSDNITGSGRYEVDQKVLLTQIKAANKNHAKINCIQFLVPDRLLQYGFKSTLELIAEQSGGIYRFVPAKELGLN